MTPAAGIPMSQLCTVTTPNARAMIALLGSPWSHGNVRVSRDESHALERLYPAAVEYTSILDRAGSELNLARKAAEDGLRIVAWLARFCEPGEDPLKVVVRLATAAGYDTCEDGAWAGGIDEEDEP